MQKKVMEDDIMRLKKNGENIRNQEDKKVRRNNQAFNNDNDSIFNNNVEN